MVDVLEEKRMRQMSCVGVMLVAMVLVGCAHSAPERPVGASHPANPGAAEGVVPDADRTLSTGDVRLPANEERAARAGTGSAAASKPTTAGAALYTCPMHKDFVTSDPGARCPKCGMKLVPKVAAGTPKAGELIK
jgi:DNA-directed RNA polymerase subunit RPC12/RpoP